MPRYISSLLLHDLQKKMVFLGGPRQVGKTTLAKEIGSQFENFLYLTWDKTADQKKILAQTFSPEEKLLIFDEIHKYRNWKNTIKGIYDTHENNHILVTGSARLDLYRKGGDSLLGRYFYTRLHPFSLAEILQKDIPTECNPLLWKFSTLVDAQNILSDLLLFGPFPEPFFEKDIRFAKRWREERTKRLIREDIRDISTIKDLSQLEILIPFLEEKVGGLFSLNALREDFSVHHSTITRWIETLEHFYYLFRIYPFQSKKIQSLKKEPKIFLWEYSVVENEAARFENCIASHLLKYVHFFQDFYGEKLELCYLRDKSQREVDFLIIKNQKPFIALEVKTSQEKISVPLKYFKEKLDIPFCYQIVQKSGIDFEKNAIRVISAEKFLQILV